MSYSLELDGQTIPVTLRWHARAKRIILRLDTSGKGAIVTLPKGVKADAGLQMAQKNTVWLANQFNRRPEPCPFKDNAIIPVRDVEYTLHHCPDSRGTVWTEGQDVFVAGQEAFFKRRLTDWLKKQARHDITPLAHEMAGALGKNIKRISLRDTRSRWGSCSSSGNLSFNWRLIFAPSEILKYVVAHEVAHLRHMDHSQQFWDTVHLFDVDDKAARRWLKQNSARLQEYGQN